MQQNLQNYTDELQKMDEAALTGVGASAKFATSLIQNTKGFLSLASNDTKSFYDDAVAKDSYTTFTLQFFFILAEKRPQICTFMPCEM